MEPPTKRAKLGYTPYNEDDDDEISMGPEEFAARQDPGFQLERKRHAASTRLKSTFEDIFEKYGKDFGDEGDEINLYTGELAVDNGHLRSLEIEREDGTRKSDVWTGRKKGLKAGEAEEDSEDEEERILHGNKDQSKAVIPRPLNPVSEISHRFGNWGNGPSLFGAASPPRLSSMFGPSGFQFTNGRLSFGSFGNAGALIDPRWQAPELPMPDPSRVFLSPSGFGSSRLVPIKTKVRKALPAPAEDADEEDDLLLAPADRALNHEKVSGVVNNGEQTQAASKSTVAQPTVATIADGSDGNKENEMARTSGGAGPKTASKVKSKSKNVTAENASTTPTVEKAKKSSAGQTGPGPAKRRGPKPRTAAVVIQAKASEAGDTTIPSGSHEGSELAADAAHHQVVVAEKRKRGRPRREDAPASVEGDEDDTTDLDTELPDGSFGWGHGPPRHERLVIEIVEMKRQPAQEVHSDAITEVATANDTLQQPTQAPAPDHDEAISEHCSMSAETLADLEAQFEIPTPIETAGPSATEEPKGTSQPPRESFSRNVLDSSYAFSDEEDGFIAKKPGSRPSGVLNSQPALEQADEAADVTASSEPMDVTNASDDIAPENPDTSAEPLVADAPEPTMESTAGIVEEDPPFMGTPAAGSKKCTPRVYSSKKKRREEDRLQKALARPTPSKQPQPHSRPRERRRLSSPKVATPSLPSLQEDANEVPTTASATKSTSHRKAKATPQTHASRINSTKKSTPAHTPTRTAPKTPSKTHSKRKTPLSTATSVLDLMSESEDELSFGPDDFTPGGHVRRTNLTSSSPKLPSSPVSAVVNNRRASAAVSRKLASEPRRRSMGFMFGGRRASSPADSLLVRTPGGTTRKCGEDGFVCDRDFCFVCLKM